MLKRDKKALTALLVAAAIVGVVALVSWLVLRRGTSGDRMMEAIRRGDVATVKLWLARGVDPNTRYYGPIVKFMHLGRPDPTHSVTLLHFAGNGPSVEVLRLMVEAGGDVNAAGLEGSTPLINAAGFGRVENVRYLVAHGANVNYRTRYGETPLSFARALKERAKATGHSALGDAAKDKAAAAEIVAILKKAGAKE